MSYLISVKPNWKTELKTALFYSALFIIVNIIIPQLTIGFPYRLTASFATNFLLASVIAPVGEELFFRYFLMNTMWAMRIAIPAIVIVTSGLFSLFHYSAYGASLSAQSASFVGALLFGVVASIVAIRKGSVVTPIIIHSAFNTWLQLKTFIT